MFGYVTVNHERLSEQEKERYGSYYCGFCGALKDNYGRMGQLTLSYDMTFLILLLSDLYDCEDRTEEVRCAMHPAKRRLHRSNWTTEYAADMNILLSRYKCMDDWQDEHRVDKLTIAGLLEAGAGRVEKKYPEKAEAIRSCLFELSACEQRGERDVDAAAGCFGRLMAVLFAPREDIWADDLKRMGFYLGKFIYLMDAYEDIEADLRKGCYNLFSEKVTEPSFEEDVYEMLQMMLAECCRYFERLPIVEHAALLKNILYSGIWSRYAQVRERREKHKERKKTGIRGQTLWTLTRCSALVGMPRTRK